MFQFGYTCTYTCDKLKLVFSLLNYTGHSVMTAQFIHLIKESMVISLNSDSQLFAYTKVLEYVSERFIGGNLTACDFCQMVQA